MSMEKVPLRMRRLSTTDFSPSLRPAFVEAARASGPDVPSPEDAPRLSSADLVWAQQSLHFTLSYTRDLISGRPMPVSTVPYDDISVFHVGNQILMARAAHIETRRIDSLLPLEIDGLGFTEKTLTGYMIRNGFEPSTEISLVALDPMSFRVLEADETGVREVLRPSRRGLRYN